MQFKDILRPIIPDVLHPRNLARARIMRRSRGKVIGGPFAGQTYITSDSDFIEPGMLIGSYEKELHQAIETILSNPPALFVDVGAAQGYFAVGFARRSPSSRHIAFEFYEPRVSQLKRTADANAVKIELWGQCSPVRLQEALEQSGDVFILVDVEGYEKELLDPDQIPLLKRARMIVETHDDIVGGVSDEIVRRFAPSHEIEVIEMRERTMGDLPFLICDRWTLGQVNEGRGASQKWLVMTPSI